MLPSLHMLENKKKIWLLLACDNHVTSNEVVAMDKKFEDQLVPENNPGHPSNWEHQHQCVETHDLPPTSEKWKKCEKTIKRSLPVTIIILEAYNFNKARMLKKNWNCSQS